MAISESFTIPKIPRITVIGSRLILKLVSHIQLVGQENFPPPPYLIVSNHISYGDSLVAAALTRDSVPALTAKKYQGTRLGKLMEIFFAPIWIEQEAPDRQALRQALAVLQAGSALALAPEGTRSRNGALQTGREGAAFLIRKADVPIVPMAFYGTQFLFKKFRAKVGGIVGKPYRLPSVPRPNKQTLKEDTLRIMCSIAALLPPEYRGVYAQHPLLEEMSQLVRP